MNKPLIIILRVLACNNKPSRLSVRSTKRECPFFKSSELSLILPLRARWHCLYCTYCLPFLTACGCHQKYQTFQLLEKASANAQLDNPRNLQFKLFFHAIGVLGDECLP